VGGVGCSTAQSGGGGGGPKYNGATDEWNWDGYIPAYVEVNDNNFQMGNIVSLGSREVRRRDTTDD
jgi:hypothetical protein